jgi:catechol 2,3-dioxygenase-like lactoylglutathione lyase family enzyme
MLSEFTPVPTLAVRDLEKARTFYEDVLGFTPVGDAPDGVMYRAGSSQILVYPSAYAGTNKATAASFQVPAGAFDAEVAALRASGLVFQTFEVADMSWEDGVATMGEMRAVWFADPDGNILNVETSLEPALA